jgi:hypothetical protein
MATAPDVREVIVACGWREEEDAEVPFVTDEQTEEIALTHVTVK